MAEGECEACCNAFSRVEEFASMISSRLSEYEFETFNTGSRVWGSLRALQELLSLKGIDYDIKGKFNAELSRAISSKTGKIRSVNPDVTVIFDLETFDFEIEVRPVYIYGRYIKRVRNISQTRWVCGYCRGKGCEKCNFTGRKYGTSVEELISVPAVGMFLAMDAKLHGAGREDVDARMLGSGRPFVLEILGPKRRYVPLDELERVINTYAGGKVRVFDLEYADSARVREVKMERHRKRYRAKIIFETEVERKELLKALEQLRGEIRQRTPKRVLHRRADRLRIRRVFETELLFHSGKIAVVEIEAEAGLYIKELVSGDDGRTEPSLSSILGVKGKVEKLDVIEVMD
nr:tRNA pseudouridine(54/55) synthase Pus10 [Archaeoglobus neptunius]